MMADKKMRLGFQGPPGSGKGTYIMRLSPILGIPQISTGTLCREAVQSGSERGKKVNEYMSKGLLVPDELITEMLKERLEKPDCKKGFILDGYPRNFNQVLLLEKITALDLVIKLCIPEDILIEKLAARWQCRKCGDIYNLANINRSGVRIPPMLPKVPGKCDKCGGKIYQRPDDAPDKVKTRLVVQAVNPKVIEFYKKKGILKGFNVRGPPEEMVPELLELIKKTLQ